MSGDGAPTPRTPAPAPADPPRADVAVVGAGAAGLCAAIHAARAAPAGARVVVVDGQARPGRKILVSGGGRCNVLPAEDDPSAFHTGGSPHLVRRVLAAFPLDAQARWFERDLGVPLRVEEETRKRFPRSGRAADVLAALLAAAAEAGAELVVPFRVETLTRADGGFVIGADDGRRLVAERVILATGGKSVPKTGSDGHGYALARRLGHTVTPPFPALVPLLGGDAATHALSGLSVPVAWRAVADGRTAARGAGAFLFTHRGFSGPAVLDASHHVIRDGAELRIAFAERDAAAWQALLRDAPGERRLAAFLAETLPRRLARERAERAGCPPDLPLGQLDRGRRRRLAELLGDWPLPVTGHRGFAVAEVTGGGVPLAELTTRDLASRLVPGLHLCGEVLDVFGRIGGFNFQWAWASGRVAGLAAATETGHPGCADGGKV